eukprot:scaffold3761_cov372-Prasinococcus_capsulatus_cf.AAC.11
MWAAALGDKPGSMYSLVCPYDCWACVGDPEVVSLRPLSWLLRCLDELIGVSCPMECDWCSRCRDAVLRSSLTIVPLSGVSMETEPFCVITHLVSFLRGGGWLCVPS